MRLIKRVLTSLVTGILLLSVLMLGSTVAAGPTGLSVDFERTKETPVSVEFRVTLTNPTDKPMKSLPLDILLEDLSFSTYTLKNIRMQVTTLETYTVEIPITEVQEKSYASVFGYYKLTTDEMGGTYFRDFTLDGVFVIKEGYYQTFDKETSTFYWNETVVVGHSYEERQREVKETFKDWYFKGRTVPMNSYITVPANNENPEGWGNGIKVFDITINTGLQELPDGSWGSKGLMKWSLGGNTYFDKVNSSWWNTSWNYRKKLTFDNSGCSENLTNVSVFVSCNTTTFDFSHALANGDDIRFVDADDTTALDYFAETWDAGAKGIFRVEVPQIDSGSSTDYIWIYYGNSGAANAEDMNGVFTTDVKLASTYKNSTSTNLTDATSNNNYGTFKAAGEPAWAQEAGGLWFLDLDGTDDIVNCGNSADMDIATTGQITIELWAKPTEVGSNYDNLISRMISNVNNYQIIPPGMFPQVIGFYVNDGNEVKAVSTTVLQIGTWYHIMAIHDGANVKIAINGVVERTAAQGVPTGGAADFFIGKDAITGGRFFGGHIALPRVYNAVLSAEEIENHYLQEKHLFGIAGNFVTFGSEEGLPSVTTLTANSVGLTSARVSGNVTGAVAVTITERGFVWDTTTHGDPGNTAPASSNYTSNWTDSGSWGVGVFTHEITSLPESTLYYFRACAKSDSGYWVYGGELTFTTWTLQLWFQPNAIISGTTLPDRAGTSQNGTITWGSNPAGIAVSVGGLESTGETATVTEEAEPSAFVPATESVPMFEESTGENIPLFYPMFKIAADITGWPIQVFWIAGTLTLAVVAGALAMIYLRSVMIAALVSGGATAVFCSMGLIPWWALYVYVIMAAAFVLYQKVASI